MFAKWMRMLLGTVVKLGLAIVEIVAALLLLCACTLLINGLFSLISIRHYSANTMPDNYFPVLVQNHQQEIYPIDLKQLKATEHQPVRTPITLLNKQKALFVRLHLLENGSYELYADLDTAVITTRYRIRQQGIEPLYYRVNRNIGTAFLSFLLALPLSALLFWLIRKAWHLWVYTKLTA